MKIVETDTYSRLEQKQNNRDFISSVLDAITAICKVDKHFAESKNNIHQIDETISDLNMKIQKQDGLLSQSQDIKRDLKKKISILDDENFSKKSELLESLGSTIWKYMKQTF